jgi:hypothetical protein
MKKEQNMDTAEELLLAKGFFRLSGEKRAEILGMAKALTYAQVGNSLKAMASSSLSPVRGEPAYAGQRLPAR